MHARVVTSRDSREVTVHALVKRFAFAHAAKQMGVEESWKRAPWDTYHSENEREGCLPYASPSLWIDRKPSHGAPIEYY